MQTTAGSLALVGSRVPRDATVVARLRAAGAIVLGKTNLSEWANMRGLHPKAVADAGVHVNGWSARGGFTRNPYDLAADPCGSSSGSGVAAAANLCAVAIGTETDGSIVCPSARNAVVGLKPTVGLVSQAGLIPISHSQDTAGPMGRSVTDAAILLSAIRSPFGEVVGHAAPARLPGRRSGRARCAARGSASTADISPATHADDGLNRLAERAFETLVALGATLVDPIESVDTALDRGRRDDGPVHRMQGRHGRLPAAAAEHERPDSLADVIAFNDEHCEAELALLRPGAARGRRGDGRASTTRPIARRAPGAWPRPGPTASTGSSPATASTRSSAPAYGDCQRARGVGLPGRSRSRPA